VNNPEQPMAHFVNGTFDARKNGISTSLVVSGINWETLGTRGSATI